MFQNYNILKKVTFLIKSKKHESLIAWIFTKYNNISIFPEGGYLKVELLLNNSEINNFSSINLRKKFGNFTLTTIKKKDWVYQNIKDDQGTQTEFFYISQGLSTKISNRKFKLKIPANNAFGTGSHESTFLSIICIEYLIKKKYYSSICDVGTGSGILSFVLNKTTKQKIDSIDNDNKIKKTFLKNLSTNHLNNVRFFNQNGLNSFFLRNKSYDLIVANILLITHRKLVKQYYNKLKNNGEIVISGILVDQEMEIISIFNKFNFKLKKKFYSFKWVGLIFEKKRK